MRVAALGEVETALEFEALTGVEPVIWETACGWCGRLTLVAAEEAEGLCPRCHWSAREE